MVISAISNKIHKHAIMKFKEYFCKRRYISTKYKAISRKVKVHSYSELAIESDEEPTSILRLTLNVRHCLYTNDLVVPTGRHKIIAARINPPSTISCTVLLSVK